jgi:hypothetical protein
MRTRESLLASAEAFERAGHSFSAELARDLARDCLAMETAGFGDNLFRHWAAELAERASGLSEREAA